MRGTVSGSAIYLNEKSDPASIILLLLCHQIGCKNFRIRVMLRRIQIHGSVQVRWITDPDPALSIYGFHDANKKFFC
jgi:hypothetical protein